jgi:hypothetical protein
MTNPNPHLDRPRPLPIQVRLQPGEHPISFIRRLAEANHLCPSHMRLYLNVTPGAIGRISIQRLAAVTGRTVDELRRVMPTLPPAKLKPPPRPKRPRTPKPRRPRAAKPKPATTPQRRTTPKPRTIIKATQINPAAKRHPTIIDLSERFRVPCRTIIQALAGHVGARDHLRPHRTPSLNPLAGHIEQILATEPNTAIYSIWRQLTGQHNAKISYGTLRNHINRLRAHPDDPRYLKAVLSRADLFAAIREHAACHDLPPLLTTQDPPEPAADPDPPPEQLDPAPMPAAIEADLLPDEDEPTPEPTPALGHTSRKTWRTRCLEPWHPLIDRMLTDDPEITVTAIWRQLIDAHHANVSYNTVRHHVAQVRRPPPDRATSNSGQK